MLIAHAPAGYLLTRVLSATLFKTSVEPNRRNRFYQVLMAAGVIGAIFPDIDLLYQMVFDPGCVSHHLYCTHFPLFWIAVWSTLFAVGMILKTPRLVIAGSIFCANSLLHCVLDTLTGEIYWFAPFSHIGLNVFTVANVHVWWVRNYVDHWTFLVEIGITTVAMLVFLRVKETLGDLCRFFLGNPKLRLLALRLSVCALAACVVFMIGSIKFNLNHRIVHKAKQLKQYIARTTFPS